MARRLLATSERFVGQGDFDAFLDYQVERTRDLYQRGTSPALVQESTYAFRDALQRLIGRLAPLKIDDQQVVSTLVATTPFLRSQIIFGRLSRAAERPSALQVPFILAVLGVLAGAAHNAGQTRVTFQTVSRLLHRHYALCRLLAGVHQPMMWNPDRTIPWTWDGPASEGAKYARLVKALLPQTQSRNRVALGELLGEILGAGDGGDVVFLKAVAQRLNGRLTEVGTVSSGAVLGRMGRHAQQWTLARISESAIMAFGGRRRPRRG